MKITLIVVLITISFLAILQGCTSQPKDYEVINFRSLENKKVSIRYKYDPQGDQYILELNKKEKMCIQDARGLDPRADILANKFLELPVIARGGSGEAVRRCIVICVSKNKLYKSLVFTSFVGAIADVNSYKTKITGVIEKNKSFELTVGGKKLQFDPDQKIFFDGYYALNGTYYVSSDKDPISKMVVFQNEKYPTTFDSYIFIGNKWFLMGPVGSFSLVELASNCN